MATPVLANQLSQQILKRLPNSAGFTLVELIVTLALLVAITSIAAPNLSRFIERSNFKSNTGKLANVLSEARSQALTSKSTVDVCWNFTQTTTSFPATTNITGIEIPPNSIVAAIDVQPTDTMIRIATLDVDASLTIIDNSTTDCLAFNVYGSLNTNTGVTFTATSTKSQEQLITSVSASGRTSTQFLEI